ncbi:MAG: hypothetical protein AAF264_05115 [Pseudomonadota bacterium]
MRFPLALTLFLAACGGLPPEARTLPAPNADLPPPRLEPLNPILAELSVAPVAAPAGEVLLERGAALADRAVIPPVTGDLAERGEQLRQRAEALRAEEI